MEIVPAKLEPRPLSLISDIGHFDCGDKDLNEFLCENALGYQEQKLAQTMLLYFKDTLVGYYTLACDSIMLASKEKASFLQRKQISSYPALKIARMAFIKECQSKGCGTYILKLLKGFVYKLNKDGTGCRFITVDAYPKRIKFYLKRGFTYNGHKTYRKKSHPSLRYDVWKHTEEMHASQNDS